LSGQVLPNDCWSDPPSDYVDKPALHVLSEHVAHYLEPAFQEQRRVPAKAIFWGLRVAALGIFLWLLYLPTLGRVFAWIRNGSPA